ncbi:aurora kinase B [Homo sapiens]|uniref:Aurora kinase B n=1 Tax=Homo sapiens TaxID=9606 RepID=J3KRF8_HUMAN|nr:aurora kinase B [Homo sapiens]KAI4047802.1 aurora kinase B [Homo sapiens]
MAQKENSYPWPYGRQTAPSGLSTLPQRVLRKEPVTPSALVLMSRSNVQPTAAPGQKVMENSSGTPDILTRHFTIDDFEIGRPLGKDHGGVGRCSNVLPWEEGDSQRHKARKSALRAQGRAEDC